jgi:DNA-binding NarL/FixJ family response regulator
MQVQGMNKSAKSFRAKKRILVVDDHPMTREGIVQWIRGEPDLAICGEAETSAQALEIVTRRKPDLVLTDIGLPDKLGIELIKDIKALCPETLILVISMHDETLYAERVLRAGARGYITKAEGGETLLQAIRRVLGGQIYVSERMSARIVEAFSGQVSAERTGIERLSDREFEIFQLLGKGISTQEIGDRLHLSIKTVDAHRANIKGKLQIKSSAELISYAARWIAQQELSRRES